ncbi:hypothetical protein [Streptomyces sp. NPDC058623]|uniref:hypothetical protein n=1 Tax=Streptomyces sp. NPDC058623 TaxID=3346563 RepID=UPI003667684E
MALGHGARRILGLVREDEVAGGSDEVAGGSDATDGTGRDGTGETVREAPGPDQERSNN